MNIIEEFVEKINALEEELAVFVTANELSYDVKQHMWVVTNANNLLAEIKDSKLLDDNEKGVLTNMVLAVFESATYEK